MFRWFRNRFKKTDARHRHPDNLRRRPFEAATTENISTLQKQLVSVEQSRAIDTVYESSLTAKDKIVLISEIVRDN